MYINDIHKDISCSTVYLFADDTNLFQTNSNVKLLSEKINVDFLNLSTWLNANKICLNANKTQYLLFWHKRKRLNFAVTLDVDCQQMKLCSFIKYLGLYFDENLKFYHHIDNMASKLRRANGALCKLRLFVPLTVLKNVIYAYSIWLNNVLCSCGLGPKLQRSCKRISILQKRAIRIMSVASTKTHSSPLFKSLDVLKLTGQIKCQNILLIHQILNNNIPQQVIDTFGLIIYDHKYPTRANKIQDFRIPFYNTVSSGKFPIKCQCFPWATP